MAGFSLEQKKIDLENCLGSLLDAKATVVRTWLSLEPYRALIPESANAHEKELYLAHTHAALKVLECEASQGQEYETGDLCEWRVGKVLRMVEAASGDARLKLHRISEELGVFERYLARLFRQRVGVSFRKHLKTVRLRKAVDLLHNAVVPIKQVAGICGYADQSNFCHDFKAAFGLTPKSYRFSAIRQMDLNCTPDRGE